MLVLEVCALFRRNDDHLQDALFSDHQSLKPSVKKMLQRSWAALFYQSVFCHIDEELFAPLYAEMGRPNFPVNRLLALEIILAIYDRMQESIDKGESFVSRLDSPPGPPSVWPIPEGEPWPEHVHRERGRASATNS